MPAQYATLRRIRYPKIPFNPHFFGGGQFLSTHFCQLTPRFLRLFKLSLLPKTQPILPLPPAGINGGGQKKEDKTYNGDHITKTVILNYYKMFYKNMYFVIAYNTINYSKSFSQVCTIFWAGSVRSFHSLYLPPPKDWIMKPQNATVDSCPFPVGSQDTPIIFFGGGTVWLEMGGGGWSNLQ